MAQPNSSRLTEVEEGFRKFFHKWLYMQNQYVNRLVSEIEAFKHGQNQGDISTLIVRQLVDRVVGHYEQLVEAKARFLETDAVRVLWPGWVSSTRLEDIYIWLAGWRPRTVLDLLCYKMELQIRDRLGESSVQGTIIRDFANLLTHQMEQIAEAKKTIITDECKITEDMGKYQAKKLANQAMTSELSNKEAEEASNNNNKEEKPEGLKHLLHRADVLRMTTLKSVVQILTPIQAVDFLITVAELFELLNNYGGSK